MKRLVYLTSREYKHLLMSYLICSNPLCRRKWKLLSDAALRVFCPSCKKSLDHIFHPCEAQYLSAIFFRWLDIYNELVVVLKFPPLKSQAPNKIDIQSEADLCLQFENYFPPPPDIATIRNWSSCSQRKKPETVRVIKKWKHLVLLEGGFYFIDWMDTFHVGDHVKFLAFPNPSISERALLPNLVKPLENTEDGSEPVHKEIENLLAELDSSNGNNSLRVNSSESSSTTIDNSPVFLKAPPGEPARRPDWIPDTPMTPFYLHKSFSENAPPGPLLDLLLKRV
jgi:hypothetical protein